MEGLFCFRHNVLQKVAVIFGYDAFLIVKVRHAFAATIEGKDKDVCLVVRAFDKMWLIGLDKDDFALF